MMPAAALEIQMLGRSSAFSAKTNTTCAKLNFAKGWESTMRNPASLYVNFETDIGRLPPLSTFHATLHLQSNDSEEISCRQANITPTLDPTTISAIGYTTWGVFLFVFLVGVLRSVYSAPVTLDEEQRSIRTVLPNVGDCLQYIQFVFLTGGLSLRYPGFYQPVVSNLNWFSLFVVGPVTHGVTYDKVQDGIYVMNGTYGGTFGLELMTQIAGAPMTMDTWINMVVLMVIVALGCAVVIEVVWLVNRHRNSDGEVSESTVGLRHTFSRVLRIILSYFMLPLAALSFYQLDHASFLPAYHTSLAVALIVAMMGAFIWLLRQIPTHSLGVLIFDSTKRYRRIAPTEDFRRHDETFILILFVLVFVRGAAIGGLQISGPAQLAVLGSCELLLLASIAGFQAYSTFSIGAIAATMRLCSLIFMVSFLPDLAGHETKSAIGYLLLALHTGMLLLGFFVPAVCDLVALCKRWWKTPRPDVYGLRQLRQKPAAPAGPPNGGLQAWLHILGSFLLYFNTWGLISSFGAFQAYYASDILRDNTAFQISTIGSLQNFLMVFLGFIIGPIFDLGYSRYLLIIGSLLVLVGLILQAFCQNLWQFLLCQGLIIGIGTGCLSTLGVALPSQWFSTRLPLANGIAANGSGVGGLVLPALFRAMQPKIGFRWTVLVFALISLVTLGVSLLVIKTSSLKTPPARRPWIDRSVFRDAPFLLFLGACCLLFLGMYTPYVYVQSYALDNALSSPDVALYLLSILNGASIVGRIVPNFIVPYTGILNMICAAVFVMSIAAFCFAATDSQGSLIAVTVVYGFFAGTFFALQPTTFVRLTADKSYMGTRFGLVGLRVVRSLQDHGFTVTAISRTSSTATFPAGVAVRKADLSSVESLTAALAGQDAVVSAISTVAAVVKGAQDPLVDAAIAAGVKRFIPSEYGLNTRNLKGEILGDWLIAKTEAVDYLIEKAKAHEGFTWTGIGTSLFFDWSITRGIYGIDLANKSIDIFDSGNQKVSTTSLVFLAEGIAAVIKHPDETANQYINIIEFDVTQNQLLKLFEEETGAKWTVNHKTADEVNEEGKRKLAAGGRFPFEEFLIKYHFADVPGHSIPEEGKANKVLELPQSDLREFVKGYIKENSK
ncbi:hypothetical protein KHU50_006487 [Colletotrichum sp. SAR 10_65]|nr:hypothetical protein KHU50_006487 [Colletotrichum sp. SAR 10_65]